MSARALRNLVGGEAVDAADGATLDLVDPSTGEVFGTSPRSGAADVDAACRAAADAFETWRDTTPSQRQLALLKLADLVEEHGDELVALESENTGKPIGLTASEEIPPMVDQIRFFAGAARVLDGMAAAEYLEGHTSWIRREPVGTYRQNNTLLLKGRRCPMSSSSVVDSAAWLPRASWPVPTCASP